MSLDSRGERLLAEALADAMDWDLEEMPTQEQLRQEHQFSDSFERRLRRMERQQRSGQKAQRHVTLRQLGAWAAAFVCIIGLAAVVSVGDLAQMGADKEFSSGDAASDESAGVEQAEDGAADAGAAESEWEAAEQESGQNEQTQKGIAPDWQEQLLAESARVDEAVEWRFGQMYADGEFSLYTCVKEAPERQLGGRRLSYRISNVYEVYYEQAPCDWTRVYHTTERAFSFCGKGAEQGEDYMLSELHMTRAGTYRLVRQVDSRRQVLQVEVEK